MKGNSCFSEKKDQKSSLHMKENDRLLKNEKYFDFFKMDKKNVQNFFTQIFYVKFVNCDDKKNLSCHHKKNNY